MDVFRYSETPQAPAGAAGMVRSGGHAVAAYAPSPWETGGGAHVTRLEQILMLVIDGQEVRL